VVAQFIGSPPMNLLDGTLEERDGRMVLAGPEEVWLIPQGLDQRWQAHRHRAVSVGVRPEKMRLAPLVETRPEAVWTVVHVEQLGADALIALQRGSWQVLARQAGVASVVERTRLAVHWEADQTYLFDRTTGQALDGGPPEEGKNV
jgi:ABC-type sugar transport system ATPase subunit